MIYSFPPNAQPYNRITFFAPPPGYTQLDYSNIVRWSVSEGVLRRFRTSLRNHFVRLINGINVTQAERNLLRVVETRFGPNWYDTNMVPALNYMKNTMSGRAVMATYTPFVDEITHYGKWKTGQYQASAMDMHSDFQRIDFLVQFGVE